MVLDGTGSEEVKGTSNEVLSYGEQVPAEQAIGVAPHAL